MLLPRVKILVRVRGPPKARGPGLGPRSPEANSGPGFKSLCD